MPRPIQPRCPFRSVRSRSGLGMVRMSAWTMPSTCCRGTTCSATGLSSRLSGEQLRGRAARPPHLLTSGLLTGRLASRSAALRTCNVPEPELLPRGTNGTEDVIILQRPKSRSFPQSQVEQLRRLLGGVGLTAVARGIPTDLYCDQLQMFASGRFRALVTPHGAQMMNFIYLAPGTKVTTHAIGLVGGRSSPESDSSGSGVRVLAAALCCKTLLPDQAPRKARLVLHLLEWEGSAA